MSFETISVIGLGYIGLPTAAMFASRKKKIVGVDISQEAVDTINEGKIHIVEPDLDMLVYAAVTGGYLKAVTKPEPADAFLIAVPTPLKKASDDNGGIPEPDLSFIKSAAIAIASVLKKGDIVILESTSPVGTTEQMSQWLAEFRTDLTFPQNAGEDADINVAYCPERVLPGQVVSELVENDRVIGGMTNKCSLRAVELYKIFVKGECVVTNSRTAEMAKLTENSCRDVQIAFANELSVICDKLGVNVWELISLANRHPRINILKPGPGVGGHCIAVDPWFIVSRTPHEAKIIRTARKINDMKPDWVYKKIELQVSNFLEANLNSTVKDVLIACYGLTFKADIDDMRESPAKQIVEKLLQIYAGQILLVEPNVNQLPQSLDGCSLVDLEFALKNANVHVLLVDHKEFKNVRPPFGYVVDTRGIWDNAVV